MVDRLQEILRCMWEIMECREWGKRKSVMSVFWPIQTEMDWAEELRVYL